MSTPLSNLPPGLNSVEVKSSVSTRLNPEFFDRKNKQRDKLKQNYQELSENTQKKEEFVRNQISQLTVQLDVLQTRKRRTSINHKMQTDFLNQKIDRLARDSKRLARNLDSQESAAKQTEIDCSLQESEKLKTFMVSLRPLEEAQQIVIE